MQRIYTIEREGQIDFFDNYGIQWDDEENAVLVDNTDGVYNGVLFEFKLSISNLNKTLFQAIKYLSKMRVKGESVPATIMLVDLNATTAYVYRSENYRADIHKVYTGAASKDNEGFVAGGYDQMLDYSDMVQSAQVKKILKGRKIDPDEMYIPIDIDENCIVGWAERYYREKPKASKGDFLGDDTGTAVKVIGEIRDPRHFKGLINPYMGKSNERFKYLMGRLNDKLSRKDLGAFYTPIPYAKKAAELVQIAVDRVPDGNDYIILDRCSGSGNLETALIGLTDKNGDELIEHCVVSTYEYYEYKVLQERIGDRVRDIIPPSEANVVYENGKVANADAMSEDFINNPIIRKYVDDPKCTIILFENPPYSDTNSSDFQSTKDYSSNRLQVRSFVTEKFQEASVGFNERRAAVRELSNLFIWSGIEFYLRQPEDAYVVFSPVKYFKSIGLCNKEFVAGYLFNRKHFHASESAISCILWTNNDEMRETWDLEAYDIEHGILRYDRSITIGRCHSTMVDYYDKRSMDDDIETAVWCGIDGYPVSKEKADTKSIFNENIIASIGAPQYALNGMSRILVRGPFHHHGRTFNLRRDVYLKMLPLFVAKCFYQDNWYEKDVYSTTSDGSDVYTKDPRFLKSCLIYTCLSNQNKCLSFDGSDGRHYQNELCFDTDTLASHDLASMTLDADEQVLMSLWERILNEARQTVGYNPAYKYGVYQISRELNTYKEIGSGKSKERKYDYPELNGDLESLRKLLKDYYKSHITAKMFQYELLK